MYCTTLVLHNALIYHDKDIPYMGRYIANRNGQRLGIIDWKMESLPISMRF